MDLQANPHNYEGFEQPDDFLFSTISVCMRVEEKERERERENISQSMDIISIFLINFENGWPV